jgi:hypothetical protein
MLTKQANQTRNKNMKKPLTAYMPANPPHLVTVVDKVRSYGALSFYKDNDREQRTAVNQLVNTVLWQDTNVLNMRSFFDPARDDAIARRKYVIWNPAPAMRLSMIARISVDILGVVDVQVGPYMPHEMASQIVAVANRFAAIGTFEPGDSLYEESDSVPSPVDDAKYNEPYVRALEAVAETAGVVDNLLAQENPLPHQMKAAKHRLSFAMDRLNQVRGNRDRAIRDWLEEAVSNVKTADLSPDR